MINLNNRKLKTIFMIKTIKTYFTLILVVILCLSSSYNLSAQDYNTYGFKIGYNSSNIFSQIPDELNLNHNFAIGGFYKIHITEELIFFQPEIGLSRKGSRMMLDDVNYNLNLSYIDVPLLLSIGKKNISFVEIGGYFSYLAHARLSNDDYLNVNTSDINRIDYGIALGLNANYENYAIGLRYYYGLSDVGSGSMKTLLGDKSRNSTFQVYATFTFF